MKNLETLINELCPEGVEFVKLGDIFDLFSGMSKVSNKWADTGNCKFIDYLNIYNNLNVDVNKLQNATVANFKQNVLKQGDILFTCASETPRECAISAVIRKPIADNTYLDDHLNGIRVKEEVKDKVNPAFVNYYFYSPHFRIAICKIVRGVTRFYIVNKNFLKIEIPLPPIEVQTEIVRILDKFTELEAELEAELDCRKRQYEYYRDKLLSFNNVGGQEVEWKALGELAEIGTGSSNTKDGLTEGLYPFYTRGQEVLRKNEYEFDDEAIITAGDGVGVGKVIHYVKGKYALHQRAYRFKPGDLLNARFLYFYMTSTFYKYVCGNSVSSSVSSLRKPRLLKYPIPLLPMQEQIRIVSILDRFESLTTSLTEGLPAEIAARRQQYEHYRDKLLTFKRKITA